MAQFYGTISGQAKTEASRLGSKKSGISGHIRGWNQGGKVSCWYNDKNDMDMCEIYATEGSNGGSSTLVARTNPETGKVEPVVQDEALKLAFDALIFYAQQPGGDQGEKARDTMKRIVERRFQ